MSRWSSPAPSIRFDAIGLIAPARQPVVDHGTYSLIVRPAAGEGMSVLPPGNGRADRAADIALNTADGSFPRHFTDQLELYRNFEFKPMRQHDYEATAERSETLVYVAARA
ncbi:MAG TPA: hypothetical protein VM840_12570 [Actinomycetota bacterium]|nr:hypothetical protein [Actinomycetota bacterium]